MHPYPMDTMVNTVQHITVEFTNNAGNNLQNQFNAAEQYARQQYMGGVEKIDYARNTFNGGVDNITAQGKFVQNQMTSMPGQFTSGVSNSINPRLASLGNDLAPRAMEYINDLGPARVGTGAGFGNQPMNQGMNIMSQGGFETI